MQFDMSLEGADTIGASDDGLSVQKAYGFNGELMKRGRASEFLDGYSRDLPATGFRSIKMLKTDDLLRSKRMPSQTRDTPPTSNSFPEGFLGVSSLPKPEGLLNIPDSVQTTAFPSFQSLHTRVAGLSSSSLNGNIYGVPVGFGGPFTPAQMMELEHQILMFKRLDAGAPVPPNLLLTISKTLVPSPPSAYSAASLAPHHASWGSVHLPFSGNGDPETGRCRRTDGKKWRCAREAVTDQKYCERHLNRGRHRSSRKTVEGQTGHITSRMGAASARMAFPAASSPSLSPASDSLSMTQPQVKSSNASAEPTSSGANFSRFSITKSNSKVPMPNLSGSSFPCSANFERGSLSAAKQQFLYQHSSRTETGFNSSDPLLYNAQSNSYLQSRNFGLCQDLKTRAPQHAQCFRHSIHDRPKSDGVQPEATLLATSMPAATLGRSSSSSSPLSEQLALSPLKLMREVHPIQMGLSVGDGGSSSQKQTNWGLWETPLGGPLAEVLNSTDAIANSSMEAKNSSALNLIAQGWDAISPLESSPTGVLQKTAFGTLSCSSAGSSPRPESSKVNEDCPPDDPLVPSLGILQPTVQPS